MGEIRDGAIIDALRRQMAIAAAKQVVAAGNLANVNTPGYKTRALDFSSALDNQMSARLPLAGSDPRHLATTPPPEPPTQEVAALPSRRDGNNVQLDRELLSMTQAAGEFARAQTALAAKFRLIRYAINEGR